MFEGVRTFVLRMTLKRCFAKLAPGTFKYTDENDYYVPIFNLGEERGLMIADSLKSNEVSGRLLEGVEFKVPVIEPVEELQTTELEIRRDYGRVVTKYHSIAQFWIGELTMVTEISHLKEKVSQTFFNATTRFRHDRIFVLQEMIGHHLEQQAGSGLDSILGDSAVSSFLLFPRIYGYRIYGHPFFDREFAHFEFVLDSLVASGDLSKTSQNEYGVAAVALVTIANYEKEERRHRDSVIHNYWILLLTVVLAGAAMVQIII